MNFDELLNLGKNLLNNVGSAKAQAVLDEGFIVKTDAGDYFVGNVNGRLEHRKLEAEVDMQAWVRPMKLDLRGKLPDLYFPLRIPYSTLGFMGPLSGSAGDLIVHQDGRIEFNRLIVS
jgi:hypothetical protein